MIVFALFAFLVIGALATPFVILALVWWCVWQTYKACFYIYHTFRRPRVRHVPW